MQEEIQKTLEKFDSLDINIKIAIVLMGIDTVLRINSFHLCGWSTLKGACHYLKPERTVMDTFLLAINGNKKCMEAVREFCEMAETQEIFNKFSGLGNLAERIKNLDERKVEE
jgi:hypothetical protein